jgi:dTDP-4-dehydrorhamnose reductase
MHPVLVTGGSGQVGTALKRLAPEGFELIAPGRAELDLADPEAIAAMVASRPWIAVINAAAYTAVDKAEGDVVAAWRANALAPAAFAAATRVAGIPLIHVSTDYVFDGAKPDAYVEGDPVGPVGVYGASKEAGEQAVRTANPHHIILRTAWVVSPDGANFIKTMLRLGADRPELRVVGDQHGCPTSADDIAHTLLVLLRAATGEASIGEPIISSMAAKRHGMNSPRRFLPAPRRMAAPFPRSQPSRRPIIRHRPGGQPIPGW